MESSTFIKLLTIDTKFALACQIETETGGSFNQNRNQKGLIHSSVISTFSWAGQIFFIIFQYHRTIENWKKKHFICSNLTLFIGLVPFFLPFFFSFFLFCLFFFLFSFSLGDGPQPPSNDAPAHPDPTYTFRVSYFNA